MDIVYFSVLKLPLQNVSEQPRVGAVYSVWHPVDAYARVVGLRDPVRKDLVVGSWQVLDFRCVFAVPPYEAPLIISEGRDGWEHRRLH